MTRFAGKKVGAQLREISLFKCPGRQVSGARELPHVAAIPFMIPLKPGQGYVVSLKREKSQMDPISREHWYGPSFVVIGRGGDGNSIEIKLVLPVQQRTPSRDFS